MENLELYLLCLAVAVALVGAAHAPHHRQSTKTALAVSSAIAGAIAAIVALIALID